MLEIQEAEWLRKTLIEAITELSKIAADDHSTVGLKIMEQAGRLGGLRDFLGNEIQRAETLAEIRKLVNPEAAA